MGLFERVVTLTLTGLVFAACHSNPSPNPSAPKEAEPAGQGMKVGLVLDKGGKDDKSFNAAAVEGAQRAVKELGVQLKTIESPDDSAYEPAQRTLAERGYPLVIVIGFSQADALKKVAPLFPKTQFAIVDSVVDLPNVASLMFAEHEGSYLVGYIAGLKSKSGVIGFVGGMEIDLIKRFELGYREGAEKANPKIKVLANYVGVTSDAWMNPTKGKELALSQISRGADVVFTAAGATNTGVFDAIEDKGKLGIGVDSNQNWVKPGKILTSMMKRVDVAVFDEIKGATTGKFKSGIENFSLANKGVDYAVDQYNDKLLDADTRKKVEAIRQEILSGKILVSDYYVTRKLCPSSPFKCEKFRKRTGQ